MTEDIKIQDESQDQRYFTITPRLVWAMSRNPFDYTFWSTVKGIAGESGECFLSNEDLATLSMMSTGQASDCRSYWMDIGMLIGDFRKDPGYPQPVWHLRVPNMWKANVDWSEKYPGLKERVEYKRSQLEKIKAERQAKRLEEEKRKAEQSLHQVKPSPGEGGVTPGEGGGLPGEAKNIHKENQKDSVDAVASDQPENINPNTGRRTAAKVRGDAMDGVLWGAGLATRKDAELLNRINAFPADCQDTLKALIEFLSWQASAIPQKPAHTSKGGSYAQWIKELREINNLSGEFGRDAIRAAVDASKNLTISHPGAITWALPGEVGKLAKKKQKSEEPNQVDTPFTRAVDNWIPWQPKKTWAQIQAEKNQSEQLNDDNAK